jgi:hypothetical protein
MRFAALLAFAVPALVAGPAAAASTVAPFAGLEGNWAGEGSARLAGGAVERLRCSATYAVSGGGAHLDQTLDCAGDRGRFAFRNELDATGETLLGAWRELTYRVAGGISGRGEPGLLRVTARGQAFSADATIATQGARQAIEITSQGGRFAIASIVMRRSR